MRRGGERQRRTDRLSGKGHIVKVQGLDEFDNDFADGRLLIARAGADVRPAKTRQVDRIDGVVVRQLRNQALKIITLSSERVTPDERGSGSGLELPYARPVGHGEEGNLAIWAPTPCVILGVSD